MAGEMVWCMQSLVLMKALVDAQDYKRNDMLWNLTTTFEPALVPPPNVVLGDNRSYDVLDFDDEDNEHEDVAASNA
jgi:hypothetical protein